MNGSAASKFFCNSMFDSDYLQQFVESSCNKNDNFKNTALDECKLVKIGN